MPSRGSVITFSWLPLTFLKRHSGSRWVTIWYDMYWCVLVGMFSNYYFELFPCLVWIWQGLNTPTTATSSYRCSSLKSKLASNQWWRTPSNIINSNMVLFFFEFLFEYAENVSVQRDFIPSKLIGLETVSVLISCNRKWCKSSMRRQRLQDGSFGRFNCIHPWCFSLHCFRRRGGVFLNKVASM